MKNAAKVLCTVLFTAAMILAVTIGAVEYLSTSVSFYEREFVKNNVTVDTGIEAEELRRIAIDLGNYLSNKQDTLNCIYRVGSKNVRIFGKQTVSHMEDVKNLYISGVHIGRLCFAVVLAVSAWLLLKKRTEKLCRLLRTAAIGMLGVLAGLGGIFAVSFRGAFITLHRLFFSNSDWLFSPYDYIVLLLPDGFFFDFILSVCAAVIIVSAALLIITNRRLARKRVTK